MSGEVKTKKKFGRKIEAAMAESSGVSASTGKGKGVTANAGASLCTKLVFFALLFSAALTLSLFLMDYKQGQLQELKAQLPPGARDVLDHVAKVFEDITTKLYNQVLILDKYLSSCKI